MSKVISAQQCKLHTKVTAKPYHCWWSVSCWTSVLRLQHFLQKTEVISRSTSVTFKLLNWFYHLKNHQNRHNRNDIHIPGKCHRRVSRRCQIREWDTKMQEDEGGGYRGVKFYQVMEKFLTARHQKVLLRRLATRAISPINLRTLIIWRTKQVKFHDPSRLVTYIRRVIVSCTEYMYEIMWKCCLKKFDTEWICFYGMLRCVISVFHRLTSNDNKSDTVIVLGLSINS